MLELVDMKFSDLQNNALERSFREFYKLDTAPRIKRSLVVLKSEYNRFLKSITKQRTQFEASPSTIDVNFDSFRVPFEFIAVKTDVFMPSGKLFFLYEELDKPNGITKEVRCYENDSLTTFSSYFKAEQHILEKFLEEVQVGHSN